MGLSSLFRYISVCLRGGMCKRYIQRGAVVVVGAKVFMVDLGDLLGGSKGISMRGEVRRRMKKANGFLDR